MLEADKLARKSIATDEGGPFGTVIIKNGEIVGKGNNQVVKNTDPTAHAEIVAIRDACNNLGTFSLNDCELYTNCYPCPMCLSAIIWANIKVVYYGNTKEDAEHIGFRDNEIYEYVSALDLGKEDEETLKLIPMDRDKTIEAFDEFRNKKENKTMY